MSAVQTIRRLGFRKWYERELLRSHANLVLLLLATIGLLACAEVYRRSAPLVDQLQVLAGGLASAAIGVLALRRYLYRLQHAEYVAEQAVCRRCDTYARFDADEVPGAGSRLKVRCRHCANEWEMDL
jgi:predicted Zn finger-like uncharacterized protein